MCFFLLEVWVVLLGAFGFKLHVYSCTMQKTSEKVLFVYEDYAGDAASVSEW